MKFLFPLHILMATSVAMAASVPPAFMDFPADGMRLTGESVQVTPTPEFVRMQQALSSRLQALPTEKKQEFFRTYNSTELMEYNPDLWPDKAEYERYKAEWAKITITPVQTVQMGAYDKSNNEWGLHGVSINQFTRQVTPLSVAGMSYNASDNTWVSPNGKMMPQELVTLNTNVYGARKGTTWVLQKNDAMSELMETLSISRRMNGEYLYLSYSFVERTPGSGATLAQGGYVLRFRVGQPAADPPEAAPPAPKAEAPKQEVTEDKAKEEQPRERRKKRRNRRRRNRN
ncbi:MAG: hypothetical protein IJN29_07465 [Akkermansia sp.]|nr:hypothetical protein [Akkermansia sp.]